MKIFKLAALIAVAIFSLTACGPNMVTKKQAYGEMYKEKPVSLLVLPPINQSTAADAKEFYDTTIAEPLTLHGYYVFPIEVIDSIMRNEGYPDTEELVNVPPQKFKDLFGADAVMFIVIKKWDTSYYVIGGNVKVSISYIIKSTTTGDVLWRYHDTLKVDTTGQNRVGGIAGLVLQTVETAVKTAMTNYVPIARRLNFIALNAIPAGKYSPVYEKDMKQRISKSQTQPEK
ncbi:MAG TPA: GNA1162 family protein [Desulfuromonadales bacterium]|nr:GNA1162 family protein [Desulfuromonadales bacterium]